MNKSDLLELLTYTVFALYGSLARTLADNRDTGARGWKLVWLISANAVIAGFCGFLSVPLAQVLKFDGHGKLFLAGMAGYMGLGFLSLAENLVKGGLARRGPTSPSDP